MARKESKTNNKNINIPIKNYIIFFSIIILLIVSSVILILSFINRNKKADDNSQTIESKVLKSSFNINKDNDKCIDDKLNELQETIKSYQYASIEFDNCSTYILKVDCLELDDYCSSYLEEVQNYMNKNYKKYSMDFNEVEEKKETIKVDENTEKKKNKQSVNTVSLGGNIYKCLATMNEPDGSINQGHFYKGQSLAFNYIWSNSPVWSSYTCIGDLNIDKCCKFTYDSSNKKVATVDSKGNVTGVSEGTAKITSCIYDVKTNTKLKCFSGNVKIEKDPYSDSGATSVTSVKKGSCSLIYRNYGLSELRFGLNSNYSGSIYDHIGMATNYSNVWSQSASYYCSDVDTNTVKLVYSSSNDKIIKINSDGSFKVVGAGTAYLYTKLYINNKLVDEINKLKIVVVDDRPTTTTTTTSTTTTTTKSTTTSTTTTSTTTTTTTTTKPKFSAYASLASARTCFNSSCVYGAAIKINANNGTKPYKYSFKLYNSSNTVVLSATDSSENEFSYKVTKEEVYRLEWSVRDSEGNYKSGTNEQLIKVS